MLLPGRLEGAELCVIGRRGLTGAGYRLLAPSNAAQLVLDRLEQSGAARLAPETYELLRVEAGIPQAGHELVEDYTPLEVGLDWAISGSKGCYTGQEIIARQITYDKVTRQLVGLRPEAPVEPGERVLSSGRAAGAVTSAVISPRFGPLALAVVRRPHHEAGTALEIEAVDRQVRAETVQLPFQG
jgi:folate-binding protein YgfZ